METVDAFIRLYGYPALFGAMILEQFVPPMPGEPILLGAGALAGNGRLSLWLVAALALGMPRRRFVIFDVLGAVLWVGLYVGLGFALHDQLAEAALLAERLGGWAVVIVAVAFGLYLGIKVIRRQLEVVLYCS